MLWARSFLTGFQDWAMIYDLEVQLQRELDHARAGARRCNPSKRRGHGDVIVRVRKVGPVENVEKLRAKLAAHPFRDRIEVGVVRRSEIRARDDRARDHKR